ncbi:ATP-binding protein [Candidatus Bathyarchaeota archaeon]|nr:ATP-binding protein [Candidatus Bathyarchaeota archaeon]
MSATAVPPNIYIVGAQGTGKTTVVNELERHFRSNTQMPQIVSEVARQVQREHPIIIEHIRSDPHQSLTLQKWILAAQVEAEKEALSRGSWFVSDRSGLDPIVYARRYAGLEASEEMLGSADWIVLKGRMAGSLVVVCEPGAEWPHDDDVRLIPEDREDWIQLHELFCRMLEETGLAYCVLPAAMTDLSGRVDFVLSAWRRREELDKG